MAELKNCVLRSACLRMSLLMIRTQGAYLRRRGGRFQVTCRDQELQSVPATAVDAVLLFGAVQVTTQACRALLERGVPLILLSRTGRFLGWQQPGKPKHPEIRLLQYELLRHAERRLIFAHWLVKEKIKNSRRMLRDWKQYGWLDDAEAERAGLNKILRRCQLVEDLHVLRGMEGAAARLYFDALGRSLPPTVPNWTGRNRRPPRDPANALLSLTYMLVFAELLPCCHALGLDPQLGALHGIDGDRPSLALDLLEPLRAGVCDRFVLRQLQRENFTGEDFMISPEKGCRLRPDAFRRFLTAYSRMREKRQLTRLCYQAGLDFRNWLMGETLPA